MRRKNKMMDLIFAQINVYLWVKTNTDHTSTGNTD